MRSEIKSSVGEFNRLDKANESMNWKVSQKKICRMKYREKKGWNLEKNCLREIRDTEKIS